MGFVFISRVGPGRQYWTAAAIALSLVVLTLSGCDTSNSFKSSVQRGDAIRGRVHGGQQPVSGASVHLYAAGSSGPGARAVDLLAPNVVATDALGNFAITGDYTCPTASTQVYLVAQGGDPGLGVYNPALLMMAALGNCGDLTSSTNIVIDEVTTAASAWALAQFMGPGAMVGSTATNVTGLQNAFAAANNLTNTSTGLAPGSALPNGAVTETAKLYTLADVIAACVNSDGGSACAPLFAAATTSNGAPTNTLDAALNIVRQPAANVAAVLNAAPAQGPFQPMLNTAPNDWTMSITYGGCATPCGGLNQPGGLAVDSFGNVLVANYNGGVVSKFSPAGVPASATGFPGTGLEDSYGIAIDGGDNVWVTNYESVTGANNHHEGSVSEFSSTGAELSGYGYTGGGIYSPLAVATDSTGAIWIANSQANTAALLADNGSAVSGSSGYGAPALPFPSAVAVDANHNAWFAVQSGAVKAGAARVTPAGVISIFSCSCSDPAGIAIDLSGDVWITDYSESQVVELAPSGSVAHRVALVNGNVGPQGIAVDGAGNVWAANYISGTFVELAGSTAAVMSPLQGYGLDAPLNEPYGLAIDASGNLWLSNSGGSTLTQFVGLASPIKTPLLGPPVQP